MEKVKNASTQDLIVRDLYEIRAQILGFMTGDRVIYNGLLNEKNITEGTKRIATKIARLITAELAEIDKQRIAIKEYTEEGKTEEELAAIRNAKDEELLNDKIEFEIPEKLDFKKVADLSLSSNYQFLYDTIFKE